MVKSKKAFAAAQNQQFGTSNISELTTGDGWQRMLFDIKMHIEEKSQKKCIYNLFYMVNIIIFAKTLP